MRHLLLLLASGLAASTALSNHGTEVPWTEVARARGSAPEPQDEILWRDDLAAALDEALDTGRPLFVTLRCLPCKQCASFDAAVLEGGAELDPLLARFVTVRLTDAAAIDLRVLPVDGYQDLDLSWWGYFLSDRAELYGIFGGRDHVSDETRISVPALAATLERVLAHHYDERRSTWGVDGEVPVLDGPAHSPSDLPGAASWRAKYPEAVGSCLHCHQTAAILRQPAIDAGTFDPERDLDVWPLPENVGLSLDRDHGLLVTAVEPESPAARAGLEAGDELVAADGRRLFGQADLRGVLHRGPRTEGTVELVWLEPEESEPKHGALHLSDGWRATVLDWRMSVSQDNVGASPGFFPLAGPRAGRGALSLTPFFGPRPSGPAHAAGIRGGDEIVAVDGERPDLTGRTFLVWFRKRYEPGDEVTFRLRSAGVERDVVVRPSAALTIRRPRP